MRHARGTKAHFQHHPIRTVTFEDLGRVVELAGRGTDRMMETRSDRRPRWIHRSNAPRADHPTRIGAGIVENVEHGVGLGASPNGVVSHSPGIPTPGGVDPFSP